MTAETPEPGNEEAPTKHLTLWLLECYEQGSEWHELVPFYAVSEEEAEQKAQQWIEQKSPRIFIRVKLQAYPKGFLIYRRTLPGEIEP
jgi:hypothetical protein